MGRVVWAGLGTRPVNDGNEELSTDGRRGGPHVGHRFAPADDLAGARTLSLAPFCRILSA